MNMHVQLKIYNKIPKRNKHLFWLCMKWGIFNQL